MCSKICSPAVIRRSSRPTTRHVTHSLSPSMTRVVEEAPKQGALSDPAVADSAGDRAAGDRTAVAVGDVLPARSSLLLMHSQQISLVAASLSYRLG